MSVLDKISNKKIMLVALLLLAIYPVAILAARSDAIHFRTSFLLFIISALLGFVVLVMSVFKMSKLGQAAPDASPARYLLIAVAATLIPLMLLGSNVYKAQQYPFIHDISTDTSHPPLFSEAAKDRNETDHKVDYEGEALAQAQKLSYVDIKPLVVPQDIQTVLVAVKAQVNDNGWDTLGIQSEQLPFTVEAVASSALFGFKDDVVIRLTQQGQSVIVDMRSMSRQGKSDLGANALRIQAFLKELQLRLK